MKTRTDGVKGKVRAASNLRVTINPPDYCTLNDGAEPFFNAVIKSRDVEMWNDIDTMRAVNLANLQQMIQQEYCNLHAEGMIVRGGKSGTTMIENPRVAALANMQRLEISLSKALQTDAVSTVGRSRDNVAKNVAAKNARDTLSRTEGEDPVIAGLLGGGKGMMN